MEDCAHFHYEAVELEELKVSLASKSLDKDKEKDKEKASRHESSTKKTNFVLMVSCRGKWWALGKTYTDLKTFDQVLHTCVYDRKYSKLPAVTDDGEKLSKTQIHTEVSEYFLRFTQAANHCTITCSDILRWLELDNHGNHWVVGGNAPINIQAVAAAQTVKAHSKQAVDELSLNVGDLVSIISMESSWWRGKKEFEVGFFPSECVELIRNGDQPSLVKMKAMKPVLEKKGKVASSLMASLDARPSRLSLKRAGIVKERLFGCDLSEHLQNVGRVGELPLILKSCVEFIESRGPVEGLYRLSGSTSRVQKLRNEFDANKAPDLSLPEYQLDTHSLCSLLKIYFRELPNPLFTFALYDKFIAAPNDSIAKVAELLSQLPPAHYRCAAYLIRHLAKIADQHEETRMDSKNLAIVWAPNLLKPHDADNKSPDATVLSMRQQAVAVEFLIHNAAILFEQASLPEENDKGQAWKSSAPKHKVAPPAIPLQGDKKDDVRTASPGIIDDKSTESARMSTHPSINALPDAAVWTKSEKVIADNKHEHSTADKPEQSVIKLDPSQMKPPPALPHARNPAEMSKTHKAAPLLPVENSANGRVSSAEAVKVALSQPPKSIPSSKKTPVSTPVQSPMDDEVENGKLYSQHKQNYGKIMGELEKKVTSKQLAKPANRASASLPRAGPPASSDSSDGSDIWVRRADVKDSTNKDTGKPPKAEGGQKTSPRPPQLPPSSADTVARPARMLSWPGPVNSPPTEPTSVAQTIGSEFDELDAAIESLDVAVQSLDT